ncbi:hypothetical protein BDV12DRAFT_176087 [Aspergillus spectabilis]
MVMTFGKFSTHLTMVQTKQTEESPASAKDLFPSTQVNPPSPSLKFSLADRSASNAMQSAPPPHRPKSS